MEIENAVSDLIYQITSYQFESQSEGVPEKDITKLRDHYNHLMYQALLCSAKNSMNALKKRILEHSQRIQTLLRSGHAADTTLRLSITLA